MGPKGDVENHRGKRSEPVHKEVPTFSLKQPPNGGLVQPSPGSQLLAATKGPVFFGGTRVFGGFERSNRKTTPGGVPKERPPQNMFARWLCPLWVSPASFQNPV